MTRLRTPATLILLVLLGGCSPAEAPDTATTTDAATTADEELESLQQRAEQGDADAQHELWCLRHSLLVMWRIPLQKKGLRHSSGHTRHFSHKLLQRNVLASHTNSERRKHPPGKDDAASRVRVRHRSTDP